MTIPSERRVLLLVDGPTTIPRSSEKQLQLGLILFCLPPNVTHVAQPLDVTPFNALKVRWDQVCDQYMASNPGKVVSIHVWSRLFSQAWHQAMIPTTIMSGFRISGVYPFNRLVIPCTEKALGSTPTAKLAN